MVEVVAAVAQANAAARDLTGLCRFDKSGTSYIRPARGQRHLMRLFESLSDAACLAPATCTLAIREIVRLAFALASEIYPQLLEPDINSMRWWLPLYYRRRKQVASILAARRHEPGMMGLMLEDEEQFRLELLHFLHEHRMPLEMPSYGPRNEYLFAAPEKVGVLAAALRYAIGRGRDNELFVLLADLLPVADRIEPLLAAVKVAVARHHTVLVVCPLLSSGGRSAAERARVFDGLRREFARLGVHVTSALSNEAVPMILKRLERLRGLERGVR
jgi:hypothetical protein